MATVGAGSPLQTIQYQALPFELMNYAPQILSQKHEALAEQHDAMGAIVPSTIPADAQPVVDAYMKNLDSAVNDLAKSGYSFDSRNKLSSLRREYTAKIKPIEELNKLTAEAEAIKNKAKMNPDLVASVTVPTYTEYINGKTNYDLSVVSKSEYQKLGASLREQSTQTPFSEISNGTIVSGLKSEYDDMTPDQIRQYALQDPVLRDRLMKDGIDPDKDGFEDIITSVISGIMAKPAYNVQPYEGSSLQRSRQTTPGEPKEPTLANLGSTVIDWSAANGIKLTSIKDIDRLLNNENTPPSIRSILDQKKQEIETALNAPGNEALKGRYDNIKNIKPTATDAIVAAGKKHGISTDKINDIIESAYEEAVGLELNGELVDIQNVVAEKLENVLDKSIYEEKLLSEVTYGRLKDAGTVKQVIPEYTNILRGLTSSVKQAYYSRLDEEDAVYKEMSNMFTDNIKTATNEYSATTTTAKSNIATTVVNALSSTDDVVITRATVTPKDGGKKEQMNLDKNKTTEQLQWMIDNEKVKFVKVTEPSSKENLPGTIYIKGEDKDGKIIEYNIVPPEGKAFNLFKTLGAANNQPKLILSSVDFELQRGMNMNGGVLRLDDPSLYTDLSEEDVKKLSYMKDARIKKNGDKTYSIVMGNDPINGTTYSTINDARLAAETYFKKYFINK